MNTERNRGGNIEQRAGTWVYAHWKATGDDGKIWTFGVENGTITVTGATPAEGDLLIPSSLRGCPVTAIGDSVFSSCRGLKKVTIPDCITNMGGRVFAWCSGLHTATIGNGVANVSDCAFQGGTGLTAVTIGNSVTRIGTSAFWKCNMLKSVAIPASVEQFGHFAFSDCDQLGTMYVPAAWEGTDKPSETGAPATCEIIYYDRLQQVIFDANGGECDTEYAWQAVGWTYRHLPIPTRTGYTFDGWYTAASGGTLVTMGNTVTAAEMRTLYAHWKAGKQTVTFIANGRECNEETRIYTIGESYSPLPEATREHYVLAGWFTAASGGTQVTASDVVTTDATRTFYAHWTLVEQVVIFDANGGHCEVQTNTYVVGNEYGSLPAATSVQDNCVFEGWFTAADGGVEVSATNVVPQSEIQTLYAHWASEQTVVFHMNRGRYEVAYEVFPIGETYSQLPDATWEQCVFEGWWTQQDGGIQITTNSPVTVEAIRNLYAHWRVVELLVIFDAEGGKCDFSRATYPFGAPFGYLPVPQWTGCTFEGWFGLSGLTTEDTVVTSNLIESAGSDTPGEMTLHAAWHTTADGVVWDIRGEAGGIEITGAYPTSGSSLTIPTRLVGLPVRGIGSCALQWYSGLTSVVIGENITFVRAYAFAGCRNLKKLYVPESWEGTDMLANAGVPDGCQVIYGGQE